MKEDLKKPFTSLYIFSFIFSIQYALAIYIVSSFLEERLGKEMLGIIFAIASIITILCLLEMPRLLNKIGNYRSAVILILVNIASLLWLGLSANKTAAIIAFFLYSISNYALVFSRDIFIESYSENGSIGKTRGVFLTIINLGWIFAPLITGLVVTNTSFSGAFMLSAVVMIPALFLIYPKFKIFKDPAYKKIAIADTLKKIIQDSNIRKIFQSELLLRFFYAWMVIYTPIYLHQTIGFNWEQIGLIFTIMLIPFVLLDYPLGKYSDKIGEKKMLALGFIILGISTFLIFFISSKSVLLWAFVLFMTRVGAATIEAMNEIYFFKKIKPADSGLVSFFRNSAPLSLIIAPMVATAILGFAPDKYLFLILGIILISGGLWSVLRLKEIR